ncbi:site-specific integrase [Ensifer sp. Root558]|uniref:site-specific integrase n=1 Tax=Ensifer sp. Root558 TaxID=1736558 RepID=UPI000713705D|nr:site-specific integrase [Ensifer sp. Root558]KQZ44671.1 hypothetical protein ASD63_33045 [Ensifer sp. Root558]
MRYIPIDFEMGRTPQGLLWQSEDMSDIPVIKNPDGSIFEPSLRYFGYGWLQKTFKSKSSMEPDSYSLRDYLCHLLNSGVDWVYGGRDEVLRSFRNSFSERVKEGELASAQVELKLEHVFRFYQTIDKAMPILGGNPTPQFVGYNEISPITTRRVGGTLRWSGWNKVVRRASSRPTPSFDNVERILEHLRAAAMEPLDGSWEQSLRVFAAERNWLVTCCEARAGLRRVEIWHLSLRKIAEALSKHRIITMSTGRWRNDAHPNPLNVAVHDKALRAQIVSGIERFAAQGNTTLNVDVLTKGGKERSVEFPLDLVLSLLEIGIWTVRKALFAHWEARGNTDLDYDAIFISSTGNGRRLGLKHIGEIVKDAFNELDVAGSGHRLRAYYLTEMAWLLWNQELAKAGYRPDIAVSNNVMNRLAELAGHEKPSTTERYYLDQARDRHKMKANQPSVEARKDMMNALISVSWRMEQEKCNLLRRLIYAFDDCEDDRFYRVIEAAIDKYVVPKDRPVEKKVPHLRVVSRPTPDSGKNE